MPNYSNQLFQVVIEPFLKNIPCVSPADENKDVYQYIKIIPQTHNEKLYFAERI